MLYVQKRVRPDIGPTIAFLTKRVKEPDLGGWRKLDHLVEYLKSNWDRPLILSTDEHGDLTWYVDAAFAVHADMRSHTGEGLIMGKDFIISVTTVQKLNTRSLTEAELMAVDDCMSLIYGHKIFWQSRCTQLVGISSCRIIRARYY